MLKYGYFLGGAVKKNDKIVLKKWKKTIKKLLILDSTRRMKN